MNNVLTEIVLDVRRALKDGTYPVKLRVTFQRKQKYYPTVFKVTEEEFEKIQSPKAKKEHKEKQFKLQSIERKAQDIIKGLKTFTFDAFGHKFNDAPVGDDIFSFFDKQIRKLKQTSLGTASNYECAALSLLSYVHQTPLSRNKGISIKEAAAKKKALLEKRKPLPFSSVTADFLEQFEKWLLSIGRSVSTVGIYMRPLRAIFNEAIAAEVITSDLYPFGKRKYQIPTAKNPKRYLSEEEFKKVREYEAKSETEAKYRDLFLLSCYCNGLNMKDIALLKYRHLMSGKLVTVRAKTERTVRARKTIEIFVTPAIEQIIKRWGNAPDSPDSFIFPILKPGMAPEVVRRKIQQATKASNDYLKKIAAAVGIEKNLSTIVARHTWSTLMQRSGAPISLISEGLGHQNVKTTENYLGGFDDETKRHYANLISAI